MKKYILFLSMISTYCFADIKETPPLIPKETIQIQNEKDIIQKMLFLKISQKWIHSFLITQDKNLIENNIDTVVNDCKNQQNCIGTLYVSMSQDNQKSYLFYRVFLEKNNKVCGLLQTYPSTLNLTFESTMVTIKQHVLEMLKTCMSS